MIEFPTLLYKCPGPWVGGGYSFATRPANDEAEFDAAVSDGWHPTVPLALEAWRKPVVEVSPATAPPSVPLPDDAPPTRAEIEAKCKELGIAVHHKHNDATLLKKIDDALKEPARVLDQA
jgi:hypothetical protein